MATRTVEKAGSEGEAAALPLIWTLFGGEGLAPRILVLAKMIDRVTARQLQREFGLSVAQWRVLAFIGMAGPATAAFIVEAAEVDPAEVSRSVRGLIDRGLVTRDFALGSRKTLLIAQTETGRALFEQVRGRRRDYFARIATPLATRECSCLEEALTLLAEAVAAERAGG